MTFVTLIGKKLAKKGNEFVYFGIAKDCRGCKLKMVCSNLKEGRRYRITNVRDKHHDCSLYEGGVVAVEIEKLPGRHGGYIQGGNMRQHKLRELFSVPSRGQGEEIQNCRGDGGCRLPARLRFEKSGT